MKQYLELLDKICREGVVRDDRTGTGTKGIFGYQMRFNLSEGFPLLTTKRVFLKGVIHELLWFLKGDTNIKYLVDNGVHIWDSDAFRYYNELCVKHGVLPVDKDTFLAAAGIESPIEGYRFGDLNNVYGYQWRSWPKPDGGSIDQIQGVIDTIKSNPSSRRIIVSAWNVADVGSMALPPCHTMFQFFVAEGKLFLFDKINKIKFLFRSFGNRQKLSIDCFDNLIFCTKLKPFYRLWIAIRIKKTQIRFIIFT